MSHEILTPEQTGERDLVAGEADFDAQVRAASPKDPAQTVTRPTVRAADKAGNADLPPGLARELAAYVRAEVQRAVHAAAPGVDSDRWVPHPEWPCASRRAACVLARSGEFAGVRRVGQGRGTLYLVRRSVLNAWIEAHPIDAPGEEPDDAYEREMSKRGLVRRAS